MLSQWAKPGASPLGPSHKTNRKRPAQPPVVAVSPAKGNATAMKLVMLTQMTDWQVQDEHRKITAKCGSHFTARFPGKLTELKDYLQHIERELSRRHLPIPNAQKKVGSTIDSATSPGSKENQRTSRHRRRGSVSSASTKVSVRVARRNKSMTSEEKAALATYNDERRKLLTEAMLNSGGKSRIVEDKIRSMMSRRIVPGAEEPLPAKMMHSNSDNLGAIVPAAGILAKWSKRPTQGFAMAPESSAAQRTMAAAKRPGSAGSSSKFSVISGASRLSDGPLNAALKAVRDRTQAKAKGKTPDGTPKLDFLAGRPPRPVVVEEDHDISDSDAAHDYLNKYNNKDEPLNKHKSRPARKGDKLASKREPRPSSASSMTPGGIKSYQAAIESPKTSPARMRRAAVQTHSTGVNTDPLPDEKATPARHGKSIGSLDKIGAALGDLVYVVQEGDDGRVKVGRSMDPLTRLRSMQTSNSSELKLIAVYAAVNARAVETAAHAALAKGGHRLRDKGPGNEWFDCTRVQAQRAVINALISELGDDQVTPDPFEVESQTRSTRSARSFSSSSRTSRSSASSKSSSNSSESDSSANSAHSQDSSTDAEKEDPWAVEDSFAIAEREAEAQVEKEEAERECQRKLEEEQREKAEKARLAAEEAEEEARKKKDAEEAAEEERKRKADEKKEAAAAAAAKRKAAAEEAAAKKKEAADRRKAELEEKRKAREEAAKQRREDMEKRRKEAAEKRKADLEAKAEAKKKREEEAKAKAKAAEERLERESNAKAEREAKEAAAKAAEEREAKAKAEREAKVAAMKEARERREQEAKERREKLAKEKAEKAEAERKAKAEKEEAERKAKAEKEEAERKAKAEKEEAERLRREEEEKEEAERERQAAADAHLNLSVEIPEAGQMELGEDEEAQMLEDEDGNALLDTHGKPILVYPSGIVLDSQGEEIAVDEDGNVFVDDDGVAVLVKDMPPEDVAIVDDAFTPAGAAADARAEVAVAGSGAMDSDDDEVNMDDLLAELDNGKGLPPPPAAMRAGMSSDDDDDDDDDDWATSRAAMKGKAPKSNLSSMFGRQPDSDSDTGIVDLPDSSSDVDMDMDGKENEEDGSLDDLLNRLMGKNKKQEEEAKDDAYGFYGF